MKALKLTSVAAVVAGTVVIGSASAAMASTNAPAGEAPKGLAVSRSGPGEANLTIKWKPVDGAEHYTVTVRDGATEHSKVLPAGTTSMDYKGSGACTRYRVRVTAVGKDGSIGSTGDSLVDALAPGGISSPRASRYESGSVGVVEWQAPGLNAFGGVKGYQVTVARLSDGKVVQSRVSPDTVEKVGGLDPNVRYVTRVAAYNGYGKCSSGSVILGNRIPSQPSALAVSRESSAGSTVHLKWRAPVWAGYGPVTGYRVGFGEGRVEKWISVDKPEAILNLDPGKSWIFQVRAISSDDVGDLSKAIRIEKQGAAGTLETDAKVTIDERDAGLIETHFSSPVGSSATYPKMLVRIAPTVSNAGFHDEQTISNGTATVLFDSVPCGVHTVTVTGVGVGTSKEFGRRVINRCNSGALGQEDWRTVYGSAKIAGNDVDMSSGGESRVLSLRHDGSSDMVMQTRAHLKSGWGYGVWVRASLAKSGAAVSGYSIQYDPGYANVNASYGKAILLRLWSNGSECGNPMAKVKMPANIDVYKPHDITAVVKGDTLYMSIDGVRVFDVPSLVDAKKVSGCSAPLPTGTDVGFRTWNDSTAVNFTNTTVS